MQWINGHYPFHNFLLSTVVVNQHLKRLKGFPFSSLSYPLTTYFKHEMINDNCNAGYSLDVMQYIR